MTSSKEVVSCRRFLEAWTRSQANKEQPLDDEIVTQYHQLALHFQQLSQDNDELKALAGDISPVLAAIAALKREDVVKPRRIPRASEIIKLREERAKTCTKPDSPVKRQQQENGSKPTDKTEEITTPEMRMDLSADDFKSMLETTAPQEEKLSTKAIRKRLGLVDRAGGQASASETVAREEQESIQSEMMSLAKQLKDRTQTINQSLAEDVKILDAVGQSAESNTALLDRENAKLKEQLASSIGLWTSLWLVAMLVIIFIVTYFYMKLFSRRW
ncbi:hypothetical protein P3T76_008264 [Phytophthora citrophthora]|uniref:Vesicle transport protein USE1 n=1 Tax=Phytophthora citrophthora TaxID=4793 RepID=A0AAD9GK98_9STRA|nr:hypothetical protein P3T76_008264 [Phytophthora citrophthora]